MTNPTPRLSIGLPVYNGSKYLKEVIDSLLLQTFTDFELIISDNASTDETREICEAYAMRDSRVRYHRNSVNIGAMQNWYQTFQLSSGEYFLGAAHDDAFHPDFARQCIKVLDQFLDLVVCYTKTKIIDENGNFSGNFDLVADITSPKPHIRLYNALSTDLLCIQLLGVIRSNAFRRTKEFAGYYGCDRNALAELTLLGGIYEVPDYFFYHRLYPDALGAAKSSGRSLRELQLWDPGIDWGTRFPVIKRFLNYFASIHRLVPGLKDRILCYSQLARIVFEKLLHRMAS